MDLISAGVILKTNMNEIKDEGNLGEQIGQDMWAVGVYEKKLEKDFCILQMEIIDILLAFYTLAKLVWSPFILC